MIHSALRSLFFTVLISGAAIAQGPAGPESQGSEFRMTLSTMVEMVKALDPDAAVTEYGVQLTIGNVPVTIVSDTEANRMRILVPVASASALTASDLERLMQANYDTALDARYAIANERLWSVFIHPLAELERAQFVSGLAQTVTLARNYGGSYSSGGVVFGGGDSGALYRELLDRSEEL